MSSDNNCCMPPPMTDSFRNIGRRARFYGEGRTGSTQRERASRSGRHGNSRARESLIFGDEGGAYRLLTRCSDDVCIGLSRVGGQMPSVNNRSRIAFESNLFDKYRRRITTFLYMVRLIASPMRVSTAEEGNEQACRHSHGSGYFASARPVRPEQRQMGGGR